MIAELFVACVRWLWSVRYLHSSIVSIIIDDKKEHNDIDNMWRAHTPIIPAGRNICTAFSRLHASHHHSDLIFTPTMSQTSLDQGNPFLKEFGISSTSNNHVKMAICCPRGRGTLCHEVTMWCQVVSKLSKRSAKNVSKLSQSSPKQVDSKFCQSWVKIVSKLSQVVSQISQCCLKVDPKLSPSCVQFVPSGPKWSQSCPKRCTSVVYLVPKWFQVISIYVTMKPRDVLSKVHLTLLQWLRIQYILCCSYNILCCSYPARALGALGLLLADGAPTVGGGKTFWRVD